MQAGKPQIIYNAAVAVTTQYAPPVVANVTYVGIVIPDGTDLGITIVHPAATTTDYSVEVSNMTLDEIQAGKNDWTAYTGIATLSKSAAGNDYIEFINCPFHRARIKMVTSSGTGVTVLRLNTKGR